MALIRESDRAKRTNIMLRRIERHAVPITPDRIKHVANMLVIALRRNYRNNLGADDAYYVLGTIQFFITPDDLEDMLTEKLMMLRAEIRKKIGEEESIAVELSSRAMDYSDDKGVEQSGHCVFVRLSYVPQEQVRQMLAGERS